MSNSSESLALSVLSRISPTQLLQAIQQAKHQRATERERADTQANADAIRARCQTLIGFVREAWHVLEPRTQFVEGWVVRAICDHLEALTWGRFLAMGLPNKVRFNVPPGVGKSLIVSVLWNAWQWGPCNLAHRRFLSTSYSADYVKRDTRKTRDLILSDWYQTLWPHVKLTRVAETSFENSSKGTREGVAFEGLTGGRGDVLTIDDPLSVPQSKSDADREQAKFIMRESVPTRLNDPVASAIALIMQRVHQDDPSGVWEQIGVQHIALVLPMRYEQGRHCTTPIFTDPRRQEGELLFPERFPLATVDALEREMTAYAVSGQHQQTPVPREGGMFKRAWFKPRPAMPLGYRWVRHWDLADTEATYTADPPYTAGVLLGKHPTLSQYCIADVQRCREQAPLVRRLVKATALADQIRIAQLGGSYEVQVPQDPGSAGKPIWEEELILRGDGQQVPLKEIIVGDTVIGKDGVPGMVDAVFQQGDLPTVCIKTGSGREVVAALDHPFLTPDDWVAAGALRPGSVVALRSTPRIAAIADRSAEEFRLAGYFIGDGSVTSIRRPERKVQSSKSSFCCHDHVELLDFRHCVQSVGGRTSNGYRRGEINAAGLQSWLRDTGLAGHNAYTKRVPAWVFGAPSPLVAEFLGAYFACDGFVSKDAHEVIFYSVSKALLEDVQHLLLRLGINSTLKTKNGKYLEKRHRSWLLRMRQQDDAYGRFLKRIPVHHSFKAARLASLANASIYRRFDEDYLPDQVMSVTPAGVRPCRCLTVRGQASFLVRDIVVHNTVARDMVSMLDGFDAHKLIETGSKIDRAEPMAAQAENGNVEIVVGPWNDTFLEEVTNFPGSKFKDQTDAMTGGYARLQKKKRTQPQSGGAQVLPIFAR